VYVIGLGLPFLMVAFVLDKSLRFLRKIGAYMRIIEIVSGMLLIVVGGLIVSGDVGMISEWITNNKIEE